MENSRVEAGTVTDTRKTRSSWEGEGKEKEKK